MGFVHSKNSRLAFGQIHLSAFATEASEEYSGDTEDTTTFVDTARTYVPGNEDGTVSLAGLFDGTTDAIHDVLGDLTGLADPVPYTFAPEGWTVGSPAVLADLIRTAYSVPAAVPGMVQVNLSGQATGGVDDGVTLADLAARTTSADGTAHDSGASSADGGAAHLHVTAASSADTLDAKVQHSSDGTTWVDLVTFDQATAVEGQRKTVSGTVNQHLRASWTIAGTDPEFTFAVAFARR